MSVPKVGAYSDGSYALWGVRGHIQIVITNTNSANAVLAGLFFDPYTEPVVSSTVRVQNYLYDGLSRLTGAVVYAADASETLTETTGDLHSHRQHDSGQLARRLRHTGRDGGER
jgi:hypothetical protein